MKEAVLGLVFTGIGLAIPGGIWCWLARCERRVPKGTWISNIRNEIDNMHYEDLLRRHKK